MIKFTTQKLEVESKLKQRIEFIYFAFGISKSKFISKQTINKLINNKIIFVYK
jgi:hypothetical protein